MISLVIHIVGHSVHVGMIRCRNSRRRRGMREQFQRKTAIDEHDEHERHDQSAIEE